MCVYVVIFLKEDLCTFGSKNEGLRRNNAHDSGREKTSKIPQRGTGRSHRGEQEDPTEGNRKMSKGTGRRTASEIKKILLHLDLRKE